MKEVSYNGVVVGYEKSETVDKPTVYVLGEVDGVSKEFYVIVTDEIYNRLKDLGVGVMIKGKARIVSEKPLILESTIVNIG